MKTIVDRARFIDHWASVFAGQAGKEWDKMGGVDKHFWRLSVSNCVDDAIAKAKQLKV